MADKQQPVQSAIQQLWDVTVAFIHSKTPDESWTSHVPTKFDCSFALSWQSAHLKPMDYISAEGVYKEICKHYKDDCKHWVTQQMSLQLQLAREDYIHSAVSACGDWENAQSAHLNFMPSMSCELQVLQMASANVTGTSNLGPRQEGMQPA